MDKKKIEELYRSNRYVRLGAYAALALAVVALLGFFVLPPIVKSVVIEQAGKALHRTVAVQAVRINPFAMTVDIEGLAIREPESEQVFVGFDSLHLNLEAASLFKGGIVIGEVRLVRPRLHVARLAGGRYNFSDLLDEAARAPKSEGPAPLFSVNNIQLVDGTLTFDDQPMHEKHEVRAFNLSLPFVSNMAYAVDTFVEPALSAVVNGAPLRAEAKSKPFAASGESELSLALTDLALQPYLDYVPVKLPIQLKSGVLDAELKAAFRQGGASGTSLQLSGKAAVRDLDVRDSANGALLAFKRFDVVVGAADLMQRRFVVDKVALDSPEIALRLDKKGQLNWLALMPKASGDAAPAGANVATPAGKKPASEPPLVWTLGEFDVAAGVLRIQDDSRGLPFKTVVDALSLRLAKLDGRGESPAQLTTAFRINQRAQVSVDGQVNPFSQAADLALDVKSLELLPFQPYFAEKLNVAVTRGQLTASGKLQLDGKADGENAPLAGRFSGQLTLGDFLAVDKLNSTDFLRWKSLYFGKVDVALAPMSVSLGEIALSDFFARVVVSPQGKLNLLQIVREERASGNEKPAPDAGPAAAGGGKAAVVVAEQPASQAAIPIEIGKITLQGGDVRFTDNFVKPNYTANLRKIGGSVTGLSSQAGTVATLELRGSYDDIAPLTINARINPLAAKPFLDLQAEIKGIEMTPFSTYAGKYAGYAIEKGKLSLFVKYKIDNDLLQAENRVFLDQLTFGDAVDSPEATKLPVRFAVSLLKNRNGEIDLNLPISGSLNDPQFSIGGVIVQVIVNLVTKAVTSPFALLGSLFGGEELSSLEFDPGRAAIVPAGEKRLENLAKALLDRPALKLEVTANVDPESDPEGLKRTLMERKVKALKREELTRSGAEAGSLDTIVVGAAEYPALLERVYRAEKFPKPRNVVGLVKTLPVEEMEKLILANTTVDADDLRELGDQRARVVRDWLTSHQVPPERVFVLPTRSAAGEKAESDKVAHRGQVIFSLK